MNDKQKQMSAHVIVVTIFTPSHALEAMGNRLKK